MSIAKWPASGRHIGTAPWEETTQTRGSNFLGAVLLFRRLKLPKGASLHSLRHSHCSHLLASGVPLPAVSARLGHGSIRTTQEIYSHMIHGQDDEAAKKWEEFQNQATGGEPQ
jgi:integrase